MIDLHRDNKSLCWIITRTYAREYLNVEIPDPDKFWRAKKYESYSEQHGK